MPEIGDIKKGKEINKNPFAKFIWGACKCGKERWVRIDSFGQVRSQCCRACAQKNRGMKFRYDGHPCWKGGKIIRSGYIMIRLPISDFYYSMVNASGYVMEHRLIMAKYLNRCLLSWEIVHHKNGDRQDNRLENLELLPTIKQHLSSIKWQSELNKRDRKIAQLESEISILKIQKN